MKRARMNDPFGISSWKIIRRVPSTNTALKQSGVVVRFFDPNIEHASGDFIHDDALYLSSSTYVVLITKQRRKISPQLYSELLWAFPEEVRAMAAIALSRSLIHFSPLPDQFILPVGLSANLAIKANLEKIKNMLLQGLIHQQIIPTPTFRIREAESSDVETAMRVFEAIKPDDQLMIRGLYAFLKAGHLWGDSDSTFGEEACMNIQIAREASLEMIRRKLQGHGSRTVSFADAHDYIRSEFDHGSDVATFLEYQHDLWVASKHPNPKAGPVWAPPMMADDYYETRDVVKDLFRHILLG